MNNELRKQMEALLAEYMGSDLAKNLDKFGTPENTLVNQLMVAVRKHYGECKHSLTTMISRDGENVVLCLQCGEES